LIATAEAVALQLNLIAVTLCVLLRAAGATPDSFPRWSVGTIWCELFRFVHFVKAHEDFKKQFAGLK
jgi:hypothetical protein